MVFSEWGIFLSFPVEKRIMEKNQQQKKRESPTLDGGRLSRELIGLLSIFLGLLLMLSLATFDSRDPWLNHVVSKSTVIYNRAGEFGSYTAGLLLDLFGKAAWFFPAYFFLAGGRRILASRPWPWWRWLGITLLIAVVAFFGASVDVAQLSSGTPKAIATHGGGLLGHFLFSALVGWLSSTGAWLVWTLCLLLSVQMLVGFTWFAIVVGASRVVWQSFLAMIEELREKRKQAKEYVYEDPAPEKPLPVQKFPLRPVEPVKALPVAAFPASASPAPVSLMYDDTPLSLEPPAPSVASAGSGADPLLSFGNTDEGFAFSSATKGTDLPLSTPDADDEGASDDDPPWMRDFRRNHIGVSGDAASLTIPFVMPGSVPAAPSVTLIPTVAPAPPQSVGGATANVPEFSPPEVQEPEPSEPELPEAPLGWTTAPLPDDQTEDAGAEIVIHNEVRGSIASKSTGATTQPVVAVAKTRLPSIDLIDALPPSTTVVPRELLEDMGKRLMTCLKDFGVTGELVGITPGPVITMFEVRPAPGIRVSKIANLSDELAMALMAISVRIQAPVSGTDLVGIEIPNPKSETVGLRELFESDVFKQSKSLLTLALGKDIAGHPAVADLAPLPHLLVAGATGAGKSVGINAIILSILFKARPDEVRFLLVDPKQVELAVYDGLPHLLHPVVTDMDQAKNALAWAVQEMDRRYALLKEVQVRNLGGYNAKIKEFEEKSPEHRSGLEPLPYIVIIVDEFADLMMTAAKEVEASIIRLSQLARAAGIHIILATQRPSVNVITGIIKANLPGRMAFRVASPHDSRTILDSNGAEKLLGRGDMLFKSGIAAQRLHGAFVSDDTVLRVVDYWKKQKKAEYTLDFADFGNDDSDDDLQGFAGANDISSDPMYNDVVMFVREQGKASISLIQRRFSIGFNKAARYVDQMEQDGIVGPSDGSKPRSVIR